MSSARIQIYSHEFEIKETIQRYEGRIILHTFKIGGAYDNCISVSYKYKNGIPVVAKIPHALYEPECSLDSNLENGYAEKLLKALLQYTYKKVDTLPLFIFDDMSNIDCEEKDINIPPPRAMKKPINLAFLSIAYNSQTWYEKYFGAEMVDKEKYKKYRESLDFLINPEKKISIHDFLDLIAPSDEQIEYIRKMYEKSETYRDFFKKIPFEKRCEILRPWLNTFMNHYIKKVYSSDDWEIDVRKIQEKKGGSKKKQSRKKLYPFRYKAIEYIEKHCIG